MDTFEDDKNDDELEQSWQYAKNEWESDVQSRWMQQTSKTRKIKDCSVF